MLHFFGIFLPSTGTGRTEQKPFFSDDWQLSRGERDAALLAGKLPPAPDEVEDTEDDRRWRFVTLMSSPYF
jgi:hypothetical protein